MAANPYGGGDVILNNNPFTQYVLGQYQQRHARDAAQNEYYNRLSGSVNTAGVRTQDIEGGLAQKINDWQRFGIENRQFLVNPRLDNYKTQLEFNQRHRDILEDTERSKQAAAREMEAGKQYFESQQKGTATDEDLGIINNMRSSIYSDSHYKPDGHTPYTPYDLTFLAPLPTSKDLQNFGSLIAKGYQPSTTISGENIVKDKGNPYAGVRYYTENKGFLPQDLQAIGKNAVGLLNSSKPFHRFIDDAYADPLQLENYNETFKQVTGKDIQTKQDLAAAWGIQQHAGIASTDKHERWTNSYGQALDLQNRRQTFEATQNALKRAAKKGDDAAQGQLLDAAIQRMTTSAQQNPVNYIPKNGATEKQYLIPKPTEDMLSILRNGKYNPNQMHLSADGKYVYGIFFKGHDVTDKTGKTSFVLDRPNAQGKIGVDTDLTTRIPIEEYKLLYGKKIIGQKNSVAETEDDNASATDFGNTGIDENDFGNNN